MMEHSLPADASSGGIHFDRLRGMEWLNGVFLRHINSSPLVQPQYLASLQLESNLVVWERESTREIAQEAAGPDNWDP